MLQHVISGRPADDEFPSDLKEYIDQHSGNDVLTVLETQLQGLDALFAGLDEEQALSRYEPGKWSVKEVLGHITDGERIFSYRALAIARGESASLPGFDEGEYVRNAAFDGRSLKSLGDELHHLRRAWLALLASFDADAWQRSGVANGVQVTVRAIVWATAGHAAHHVQVLRDRYGITT